MDKNQYFEQIYQEHYASVFQFIHCHVQNPACAEDIANDVFLAAYRNLHSYDENKSFITTWLYAIAGNRLKNYYKNRRRSEGSFEHYADTKGEQPEWSRDDVGRCELEMMLDSVMNTLSERNRRIVWMKYYCDMTSVEIGETLGISAGNVRIILKRSLSTLRNALCQG